MSGWEVRPSNRAHERRLRIALVLALVALPGAFYGGSWWQGRELQQQHADAASAQMRFDEQARELDELRQRLVVVSSGEQLTQQANEQSRLTIKLLEEQIFKQQQDLAFYRGVLAPDSRVDGLNIRTLDIQPAEQPGRYRYKLLLSRVGKDDQQLQGQLQISVEGRLQGKAKVMPLAQLSEQLSDDDLRFAFRHFQAIPEAGRLGELQLPEGFQPEQVRVRAQVEGAKAVERLFKWTD